MGIRTGIRTGIHRCGSVTLGFALTGLLVTAQLSPGMAGEAPLMQERNFKMSSSTSSASATAGSTTDGTAGTASTVVLRQNDDGTRIAQVIEDDRMIRITERPKTGITVIVVETVRDIDKVNRYAANTAGDLKAKHPRGYELYKKYLLDAGVAGMGAADPMKGMEDWRKAQEQVRAEMEKFQREHSGGNKSGVFKTGSATASGSSRASASSSSTSRSSRSK